MIRKSRVHSIFHWFTAHWHFLYETNVVLPYCKRGGTVRKCKYECCICHKIEYIVRRYGE